MKLGAFSISLAVTDLARSQGFYEQLGFEVIGGDAEQNWLILRNGSATIGLFHAMFDTNTLTFNPGWQQDGTPADDLTDVRDVQARLDAAGVELTERTDPDGTGPAFIVLVDPDGNPVLIDQHVDRPDGASSN